jgi:hypothetical protein
MREDGLNTPCSSNLHELLLRFSFITSPFYASDFLNLYKLMKPYTVLIFKESEKNIISSQVMSLLRNNVRYGTLHSRTISFNQKILDETSCVIKII